MREYSEQEVYSILGENSLFSPNPYAGLHWTCGACNSSSNFKPSLEFLKGVTGGQTSLLKKPQMLTRCLRCHRVNIVQAAGFWKPHLVTAAIIASDARL